MKHWLVLALLGFTTALGAQSPTTDYGTPRERAEKLTARMQNELNLREDQIGKVFALNLKYAQIVQAEIIDQDLSQWSRYNRGMKINQRKEKELKPLLSAQQYATYEKLRNQAMQKLLFGGSTSGSR